MAERVSTQDASEEIDSDCFTLCSIRLENSKLELEIGQWKTVTLTAMGMRNKPFKGQLEVRADVSDRDGKNFTKCEVTVQQNRQHRIKYTPMRRGDKLHITANGSQIPGSPFEIAVLPTPQCFQQPTRVIQGLTKPRGVAVNSKGHIIVVESPDSNGTTVSAITPDGEKICSFGSKGSGNGQLGNAHGVTVDKEDNIYVADQGNHRVLKFNSEGQFIKTVGSEGSENLQFNMPRGITYNHNDNLLYVADQVNHRIQVLTTDLAFVRAIGKEGTGNGKFKNTGSIAFDSANNIYVTDLFNYRVQVLTTTGKFLRSFSRKSNGQKLNHPWMIAIDSSNSVYVSEYESHRGTLFTSHGSYVINEWEAVCVSILSSQGGYITPFEDGITCFGLAIDNNDTLIVSDYNEDCLLLY